MLLATLPLCAQFSQLAATDDGRQLYFTSQMLFKGGGTAVTQSWPESRLFRFGGDGLSLFLERGPLASTFSISSSSGVTNPTVTADGSLVGYTLNDVCIPAGPNCKEAGNVTQIRGTRSIDPGSGTIQLSRNGKWALLTSVDEIVRTTLLDLSTNQQTVVNEGPWYTLVASRYSILASDGTVLIFSAANNQVTASLWKQGKQTPLDLPTSPIAITDDARTLIGYYAPPKGPAQLVSMNAASGKVTVVAQAATSLQAPVFMGASNDGRRILYRLMGTTSNGAAYVWDSATGASWQVPLEDGELATDGTLNGAGDFAFVATSHARIVKWTVQPGGVATALFPATPYCDDPGPVAGGSLARFHCTFDIPAADLSGKTYYEGWPMPVVYSKPGDLGLQIPWYWDNFVPKIVSFQIASPSGFEPSFEVRASDGAPAFLLADAGQSTLLGMQIVKGDWSGYVTGQPKPGDIVHIYMIGLGPVTGDVKTGEAAPLTELRPIQWKLGCNFAAADGTATAADLLFAGLAPGMLGVYQTTFRVPALPSGGVADMPCTLSSPTSAVSFTPSRPGYSMRGGVITVLPLGH